MALQQVINGRRLVQHFECDSRPIRLFALVWTTTPWTLPLNDAIAFRSSTDYVFVELLPPFREKARCVYLIAKDQVDYFLRMTNKTCEILGVISSDHFENLWYKCCLFPDIARPFFPAKHVVSGIGTGLVHTSYAHGFQDYELAVEHAEQVYCYVDENGRYKRELGYDLEGKFVLEDGQATVLDMLKKHVIHAHPYVHSYPYDWRTKKPVIVRSSAQWFMDVSDIGKRAADLIEAGAIQIGVSSSDLRSSLTTLLRSRSAWCISRQRCWGVPIPVFFKEDGTPLTSELFIEHLASRVAEEGPDIWWSSDSKSLFPENLREKVGVCSSENLVKGNDVMDVWMDSGLAWGCTPQKNGSADLLVEGMDQYRGWFQSLLLTSLALKNRIPYKRVFVHGFAVDSDGKKMSKSIGNVVDPQTITDGSLKTKALGADGLRLWVALYGSNGSPARVGADVIQEIEKNLIQIRTMLRFLLGSVDGLEGEPSVQSPHFIDKFILSETEAFVERSKKNFLEYRFQVIANEFIQFLQRPLSSHYVQFIRDRLYCGCKDDRQFAQQTLAAVGLKVVSSIAPILPHLAAEFFTHHPCISDPAVELRQCGARFIGGTNGRDKNFTELVQLVDNIRSEVLNLNSGNDTSRLGLVLSCGEKEIEKLRSIQIEDCSFSSQLVEALNVSMVILEKKAASGFSVEITQSQGGFCLRCRRNRRNVGEERCERCTKALRENISVSLDVDSL